MQRPSLPGWPARLLHGGLVALGWLVFAWSWWKVLFVQPVAALDLGLLIAGAALIAPAITLAWVVHNRGIYARKGPRQGNVAHAHAYTQDWAGAPVHADFALLRQAPRILVEHAATGKHFRGSTTKKPT